jgi:hypothetical protein
LSHNLANTFLKQLSSELEAATGIISIDPEGLNKRLNENAVPFLRGLFSCLLKAEIGSLIEIQVSIGIIFYGFVF